MPCRIKEKPTMTKRPPIPPSQNLKKVVRKIGFIQ